MTIRKAFEYRAYPTKTQVVALEYQLAEAARLYNAALQERRDAWRFQRKSVTFAQQSAQLREIRGAGDIGLANAACATDVVRRVDLAFKAFFRRLKAGERPGFPRFRPSARYDSLTFRYSTGRPDGCGFDGLNRVKFHGVGSVKFKRHREIDGEVKTVTVRRRAGRWFISFSVVAEAHPLPASDLTVGIDVGLEKFATLSDGSSVDNPRPFRSAAAALRRAQRRVARRVKRSRRQRKARLLVARAHDKIRRQRLDFHHKVARSIVNRFGRISIENLNVRGLSRTRLAKSIHDAGWSAFLNLLALKAADAARELVRVDPRGTSQTCLCGCEVRKTLADRQHDCPHCGLSMPRDLVSAILIDRLGRSRHAASAAAVALA